ncbi:pirin family protein [Billgrantia endophytica]|uniref:Pirin family protein n=1 Tax=Billgrantia endophytica TaxID=2033802 RepID=A0A2N7TX06_9GAMM|nr:pirin family protein [Halomonas endophytica]PMR72723.1 pirin family protein [Halomonas endophytica]
MSNLVNDGDLSSSLDCPVIEGKRQIQRVSPRTADVGGIPVNRVLPSRQRRLVGAWCFLDHAGPAIFKGDSSGLQVGPHPHIGLQTFTWMIEGEVLHRDSLGSEQVIRPGQVNLMTAGRGISHTEESVEGERHLHAAQLWIALPEAHRNTAPRFDHYPELPRWQAQGAELTLLVGEHAGYRAPTLTFSPLLGIDIAAGENTTLSLPLREDFEYALLPLEGELSIDGERFATNELAYLGRGRDTLEATLPAGGRAMLVGGEPLGEKILIWWNFVGHGKAEIAEAQRDWEAGSERFGTIPAYRGKRMMPPPLPWKI